MTSDCQLLQGLTGPIKTRTGRLRALANPKWFHARALGLSISGVSQKSGKVAAVCRNNVLQSCGSHSLLPQIPWAPQLLLSLRQEHQFPTVKISVYLQRKYGRLGKDIGACLEVDFQTLLANSHLPRASDQFVSVQIWLSAAAAS